MPFLSLHPIIYIRSLPFPFATAYSSRHLNPSRLMLLPRKRYLLGPDSTQSSTSRISASPETGPDHPLEPGYQGCGYLITTHSDGAVDKLLITSTTSFFVGRDPTKNDYVLPFKVVSAKHFRIFATRNELNEALISVEDLSTNGILFNGSIPATKSVFLCDGDTIGIPALDRTFTFHRDHPSAGDPSTPPTSTSSSSSSSKCIIRNNFRVHLETRLGSGSFGDVKLAFDLENKIQVACKIIHKAKLLDKGDLDRLTNELNLGLRLRHSKHPNINHLLDYDKNEADGAYYVFLPLVTGGDLFSYVLKHSRLEEAEAKYISYQLGLGVAYLHANGIAHRDLKARPSPQTRSLSYNAILANVTLAFELQLENILLKSGGSYPTVLICDFGLSTGVPRSSAMSASLSPSSSASSKRQAPLRPPADLAMSVRSPSIVGTRSYFPPEFIRAQQTNQLDRAAGRHTTSRVTLDASKSDSWALGVIVFILLAGHHPFGTDDESSNGGGGGYPARSDDSSVVTSSSARRGAFNERVCKGEIDFIPSLWKGIDPAAINLILSLLSTRVEFRLSVVDALLHKWFESDKHELEENYRIRVLEVQEKGKRRKT